MRLQGQVIARKPVKRSAVLDQYPYGNLDTPGLNPMPPVSQVPLPDRPMIERWPDMGPYLNADPSQWPGQGGRPNGTLLPDVIAAGSSLPARVMESTPRAMPGLMLPDISQLAQGGYEPLTAREQAEQDIADIHDRYGKKKKPQYRSYDEVQQPERMPLPTYDREAVDRRKAGGLPAAGIMTALGALFGNAGFGARAGIEAASGYADGVDRSAKEDYQIDTQRAMSGNALSQQNYMDRLRLIDSANDSAMSQERADQAAMQNELRGVDARYRIAQAAEDKDAERALKEKLAADAAESKRINAAAQREYGVINRLLGLANNGMLSISQSVELSRAVSKLAGMNLPDGTNMFNAMSDEDKATLKNRLDIANIGAGSRERVSAAVQKAIDARAKIAEDGRNSRAAKSNERMERISVARRTVGDKPGGIEFKQAEGHAKKAHDQIRLMADANRAVAAAGKRIFDIARNENLRDGTADPEHPLYDGLSPAGRSLMIQAERESEAAQKELLRLQAEYDSLSRQADEVYSAGVLKAREAQSQVQRLQITPYSDGPGKARTLPDPKGKPVTRAGNGGGRSVKAAPTDVFDSFEANIRAIAARRNKGAKR